MKDGEVTEFLEFNNARSEISPLCALDISHLSASVRQIVAESDCLQTQPEDKFLTVCLTNFNVSFAALIHATG